MNQSPKILALAGSSRKGSWNKKLIRIAAADARAAGADVTLIDLAEFPMPLYDGDLESEKGLPDNAVKLRRLLLDHHGLLIATPEYNGSLPGVLKNTIDWTSRPGDGHDALAPYRDKVGGILSASIGPFGGVRAAAHLRQILSKMGVTVLGAEMSVANATKAFDDAGALTDGGTGKGVSNLAASLAKAVGQLHGLTLRPGPV